MQVGAPMEMRPTYLPENDKPVYEVGVAQEASRSQENALVGLAGYRVAGSVLGDHAVDLVGYRVAHQLLGGRLVKHRGTDIVDGRLDAAVQVLAAAERAVYTPRFLASTPTQAVRARGEEGDDDLWGRPTPPGSQRVSRTRRRSACKSRGRWRQ